MAHQPTYAELRQQLDAVLAKFEQGTTQDIDVLLQDYERASKIIEELQAKLTQAKLSIKKISK
jgi:exodeoxyribonuclease VII small subunit